LLRDRDPDDTFVKAFAPGCVRGESLQGPPWLVKRNNSILAHGFVSVDCSAWEEAKNWVEANVAPFFRVAGFPQLPCEIPRLHEIVVWNRE
jgi:hypothetical protein